MQETLYCFKLNEKQGKISMFSIEEYEKKQFSNGVKYYKFKRNGQTYYAYENDLDRFKSCRMYTLNPDYAHALDIVKMTISSKRDTAKKEFERWETLYNRLEEK